MTDKLIDCLYYQRPCQRNHAQDALVWGLIEQLYDDAVWRVSVSDLGGMFETHWSVVMIETTHPEIGRK